MIEPITTRDPFIRATIKLNDVGLDLMLLPESFRAHICDSFPDRVEAFVAAPKEEPSSWPASLFVGVIIVPLVALAWWNEWVSVTVQFNVRNL